MIELDLGDDKDGFPDAGNKKRFLLKQWPFVLLLGLTLAGVAYWSFANAPITGYWMFLALLNAVVCIFIGWPHADDRQTRVRLVWTQVLHWLAILVGMNLLLLPNVAEMANADATGQAILLLLAVGTFIAGVHVPSWQLCSLGVMMAIGVPALAWLEESALLLLLAAIVVGGVGGVIWWRIRRWRTSNGDF